MAGWGENRHHGGRKNRPAQDGTGPREALHTSDSFRAI
jgi:hypothetical protein